MPRRAAAHPEPPEAVVTRNSPSSPIFASTETIVRSMPAARCRSVSTAARPPESSCSKPQWLLECPQPAWPTIAMQAVPAVAVRRRLSLMICIAFTFFGRNSDQGTTLLLRKEFRSKLVLSATRRREQRAPGTQRLRGSCPRSMQSLLRAQECRLKFITHSIKGMPGCK